MMAEGLLEYSEDPLSDTTPTYVDVTSYVVGGVADQDGKSRDLDEPAAGSMTFRLRNRDRAWEPGYSGAAFNPKPLRRFRWSVDGVAQGVWYATSWNVTWPVGTTYSEVEVSCVDGFELLSLDLLNFLDPPAATSYEEVVLQDGPFGYWRLNDLVSAAKVEAVAGPEGVYKNRTLVTLGQTGALLGDSNLAAKFAQSGGTEGRAEIPMSAVEYTADSGEVSAECWVKFDSFGASTHRVMTGPENTGSGLAPWGLEVSSAGLPKFYATVSSTVSASAIGSAISTGSWFHLLGACTQGVARLYVNGALAATATMTGGALVTPTANKPILIAWNENASAGMDGYVDEPAVYEHALSAERALAHYQAGAARGFNTQTAGARISAVATSALWAETGIQTGEHMVQATMEHGQSKLDEIRAAVKAEMPSSLFYFDGNGDPVYKGWNFQDGLAPVATFGPGAGEIKYQALEPVYDDEIFNEVTVSHESAPGEETQHTVTDAASEGQYFPRAHAETGLILTEHDDAIAVAAAILEKHKDPMQRFANITLNSASPFALAQILNRKIGDLIRIKGMSASGAPIDVVTTILGRSRTLDAHGHMTCTWSTGRGFNAAAGLWRLGVSGFTELDSTAVLG